MKTEKPHISPREHLDQRKQALTVKHRGDLHRITQEALQSRHSTWQEKWQTKWLEQWQVNWTKPALATAFSLLLVTTLVILRPSENPHDVQDQLVEHSTTAPSVNGTNNLPTWLVDTSVPLSLIENIEFYDWLAQQPENQQAKYENDTTVAFNEFYQYRLSQRLTSSNTTQRLLGTAPDSGKDQKEGI